MRAVLFGVAFAAAASFPVACNPFSPDQSVILGVTKLDAPTTIQAGNPLTVVVTVTTGGCRTFDHFSVERQASVASIVAWGRDAAKGRNDVSCPNDIRDEPHTYQFDPPFQNSFMVLAYREGLDPLTATVQIQ
jgi:hypothetical protein